METTLMKVSELAEILRCHKGTIYRLARRGHIPAIRVGGGLRFEAGRVLALLEALAPRPIVDCALPPIPRRPGSREV